MLLKKLITLSGQKLVLPFYHVVSDRDVPHVKHLHPVRSVSQFKADLEWLLKHFEPLDTDQLISLVKSQRTPSKPCFYLSFDDGLSECHDIIAPILKQKGIPAAFFINSAFTDNRNMSFRYKASLLLDWFGKQKQIPAQVAEWLAMNGSSIERLPQFLKQIDYMRKHLLDHLANTAGFSFAEYLQETQPYMSSLQLQSLVNDGFTLGAHSVDHPEYEYLEWYEQRRQTSESLQFISQFYTRHKLFAFPFTDHNVRAGFFEWLRSQVQLSFGTAGLKRERDFNFHLQRIPMERSLKPAEEIIRNQYIRWMLKAPMGKNSIRKR